MIPINEPAINTVKGFAVKQVDYYLTGIWVKILIYILYLIKSLKTSS